VFKSYYLEEFIEKKNIIEKDVETPVKYELDHQNDLIKLCNELKTQLEVRDLSLADIEKKIVIDKFTGKQQNAKD